MANIPKGPCSSFIDGEQGVNTSLCTPYGLTLDPSGNLYIADFYHGSVRKLSPTGIITTVAGNDTCCYSGDGGPAISASIYSPFGIALDGTGNMFIADYYNARIRKVSAAGIITTVAGTGNTGYSGDGGLATNAQIAGPSGVAIDAFGNLYIADTGNDRIRKVSTAGIITTIAGGGSVFGEGGPATSAQLSSPISVGLDATGSVYIADSGNNRIRKVLPNGIINTIAENGNGGYAGDGGPALAAQLRYPAGLILDQAGDMYVADTGNNAVRILQPPVPLLSIGTASLPSGTVGVPYSQTLQVRGGTPPYSWTVVSGTLPNGLVLSPSGSIGGTPTSHGNFVFTVQVSDTTSMAILQPLSITINNIPLAITTPSPLLSAATGLPYSQSISASGGTAPYRRTA